MPVKCLAIWVLKASKIFSDSEVIKKTNGYSTNVFMTENIT